MKIKKWSILLGFLFFIVCITLYTYFKSDKSDTTFECSLQDSVSKHWVWDSTVNVQNRQIRGFYQTDFIFTNLKPGNAELSIKAPFYKEKTIRLNLKKGQNVLENPVELVGFEIPGLDYFVVFDRPIGRDMGLEIRPVGRDGKAVINHPALDLAIGVIVSAQIKEGMFSEEPEDSGAERGKELFRGMIAWEWDPLPETVFRYTAKIPGGKIKEFPAPFWVIDYLIIVPDPVKIKRNEINRILTDLFINNDLDNLSNTLSNYGEKFRYFLGTVWNVEGL
jgi:hypothetical protein